MIGKGRMFQMIKIIIYVCFSAGGLILLKLGTARGFEIGLGNGVFSLKINGTLLFGMVRFISNSNVIHYNRNIRS